MVKFRIDSYASFILVMLVTFISLISLSFISGNNYINDFFTLIQAFFFIAIITIIFQVIKRRV